MHMQKPTSLEKQKIKFVKKHQIIIISVTKYKIQVSAYELQIEIKNIQAEN